MQYQWVEQQDQLHEIVKQLEQCSTRALDTEFIKVDTLYPKLGVLQVNVNQQVYLIDGRLDLSDIWTNVFLAEQNIFHACGEDIDLIYHYAQKKPLTNVFDTQIAIAFLGYGIQMGYQAALEQVLNISVEKDQTRSDWLARPLTKQQELYAASDVYYLQGLADRLILKLQDKKLYHFVLEDCQSYCVALAEELSLDDSYLDIANHRHSPKQLMQLKRLAKWREQVAIQTNQPRSYILKNNVINKLIERTPKTMQQLAYHNEIRSSVLREYGAIILELLNDLPTPSLWPERIARPYRYQQSTTKDKIEQHIQDVAQNIDIPIDVLMRKKWLSQINQYVVNDSRDIKGLTPYLQGWRLEKLIYPLMDIIRSDMLVKQVL